MLYRATAVFVVVFWVTMTALLLRNETWPGDSAIRAVPVRHVARLFFHHHQASDLNIVSDKFRLGRLRIVPQSNKEAGLELVAFEGNLHFAAPRGKRQRVAWHGEWEMDKTLATRRFQVSLTMHEPLEVRSELVVLPLENLARYELHSGRSIERQEFSLDERG